MTTLLLSSDVSIAEASSADIIDLLEIERRCFKIGDRFNYKQFWYLINKGTGIFRVMRYAHLFRGYFYLGSVRGKCARIYSIAVDPSHQGMGMASWALLWIQSLCLDTGFESIRLEVRIDNQKAIKFYQKHGFRKYDRKHRYYTDGSDAILMKKDLQCRKMDS